MTRISRTLNQTFLGTILGTILAAGPALAPLARAQTPPSASPAPPTSSQEAADIATVETATVAFAAGRYTALQPHIADLRAVMDHAPATYPRTERRGDVVIIRAGGDEYPALALAVMMQAAASGGSDVRVIQSPNTYPAAATLLGSYYYEVKQPVEALDVLERGLALQPDNVTLLIEKAETLGGLQNRWDQALAVYQSALDLGTAADANRGVLLRGKGAALTELKRLDEAEKAYRDSLIAAPNNALALNELNYIAQLRAGRPPAPGISLSPGQVPPVVQLVTPNPANFDIADANKDGKLDRAEFNTTARAQAPNDAQKAWDAADANKDGFVSRDEFMVPIPQPLSAR